MAETIACECVGQGTDWKYARDDGERIGEWMVKVGLSGDEEAALEHLERFAFVLDWGPILELPVKTCGRGLKPAIDEWGQLDWGAFGTVDFARLREPFDKALYKAHRLQEEIRHQVIMLETTGSNIPMASRLRILDEGRGGQLDLDEVEDMNEWFFARRYLRIKRLRNEIRELRRYSWERRRRSQ